MRTFLYLTCIFAVLFSCCFAQADDSCQSGEDTSLLQTRGSSNLAEALESGAVLEGNSTDAEENLRPGAWFATCGGTAGGSPCKFPFTYKFKKYNYCTTKDHGQPWCYTVHGGWGNCYCHHTCGGTARGRPCKFPFKYKGLTYATCTLKDHDEPWCYAEGGGWGNCDCGVRALTGSLLQSQESSDSEEAQESNEDLEEASTEAEESSQMLEAGDDLEEASTDAQESLQMLESGEALEGNSTEETTRPGAWFATCGGTAKGSPCKFPFTYKFKKYNYCTIKDHGQPWCYTVHGGWGNCYCHHTCGGTAKGRPCTFPFKYKGLTYATCTRKDHDEPWCYAEGGGWGNCDCGVHAISAR